MKNLKLPSKAKPAKRCKHAPCNKILSSNRLTYCSPKCQNLAKKARNKVEVGNGKALSMKTLKKEAWRYFSLYIRLLHSDKNGMSKCVTCGKVDHYKKMQAGHAVSGRGGYVLFNEKIVRPQCVGCNVMAGGRYDAYVIYLVHKEKSLTFEQYAEIKRQSKLTHKINNSEYLDIYNHYKSEVERYHELIGGE
jgi:hypothetical protein